MEQISHIIGGFHWLIVGYELLYPFLLKNYTLDIIYILFILLEMLSWLLFNDECIVSFWTKKINNHEYKAGDDSLDLSDMKSVIPSFVSKDLLVGFFAVLSIVHSYLLILVNERSHLLKPKYIYTVVLIYLFYTLYVRKFYNEELFKRFATDKYDSVMRIIFSIALSFIGFCLVKKLIPVFPLLK
jgi:hypothetical protein